MTEEQIQPPPHLGHETTIRFDMMDHKASKDLKNDLNSAISSSPNEFTRSASLQLIAFENEVNTLREKNADLIHRNFCLTFEKNELHNLIKILELKIEYNNRDNLKLLKTMPITEEKSSSNNKIIVAAQSADQRGGKLDKTSSRSSVNENEKANLIRQVEFYSNKLFLFESTVQKKDREISYLQQKVNDLTRK